MLSFRIHQSRPICPEVQSHRMVNSNFHRHLLVLAHMPRGYWGTKEGSRLKVLGLFNIMSLYALLHLLRYSSLLR